MGIRAQLLSADRPRHRPAERGLLKIEEPQLAAYGQK
jgi:hypothetical protein